MDRATDRVVVAPATMPHLHRHHRHQPKLTWFLEALREMAEDGEGPYDWQS
jgi:hypothetical protein